MFTAKFDSKEVNKILGNAVSYSYGFLEGIDIDQVLFNKTLAEYTVEGLKLYIDSQARVSVMLIISNTSGKPKEYFD